MDKLTVAMLMDMVLYFLPRHKSWLQDKCTWIMRQDGREFRYRMDYFLGTDRRLLHDVDFWNTRHHLGHYTVLVCLRGESTKELTGYLRKLRRFPFRSLRCNLASIPDKLFSELKTQIPKPPCVSGLGGIEFLDRRGWSLTPG